MSKTDEQRAREVRKSIPFHTSRLFDECLMANFAEVRAEGEANGRQLAANALHGLVTDAVPIANERHAEKDRRIAELEAALDGLLDGLDANADERCGLSEEQWRKRIVEARGAIDDIAERVLKERSK